MPHYNPLIRRLRALVLTLLCAASPTAFADLYSAAQAYGKKDFETAFSEFRALAELGQPQAQYYLAAMYARGEGVTLSNTNAHAWASLAKLNGESRAQTLLTELESQLTPTSLRYSKEIQSDFSPAKLNERLMPKFLANRDFADRDPVKRDKLFMPSYPLSAQSQGIQGQVYVEFVVAPDGRARLPRILFSVPDKYFDFAARQAILRSTYLPARVNGTPVATTTATFIQFTIRGFQKNDYPNLEHFLKETLRHAEAGDVKSQVTYAMLIAGFPQFQRPFSEALPWFLKAAQSGSPYSQYQVGTALLQGRGCQCEETKGEIWLERAAQADQPDAQVTLAEHLLKGTPSAESVAGARVWLDRAVKSGHKNAKLYAAAFFASGPENGARDPDQAMKLVSDVFEDFKDDPTTWEIRAAAFAAGGKFTNALKDETAAIDLATKLGWDLMPLQNRRAAYEAQRPWSGNLLVF